MTLTPEQIADGWIEHDGGPCPVALDMLVRICGMDGVASAASEADNWDWEGKFWTGPERIIAYRPEPADG